MGNDTYLSNSDVIKKLDDLSAAVGGTTVPTTTTKTNTDFVIGINKSIDAASGRTGVEYPPYSHNTLVTDKLDELAEAIAEGGGGGPGPTPVMGALNVTENGDYLPASYNYDGFSSVNVDVPAPPTPVMGTLSVTENGDYLPSSYNYDGFSSVSVDVETGGGYSEDLTITFDASMENEEWTCTSYDETESLSGTVGSSLTAEVSLSKKNTLYIIECAGLSAEYTSGGSASVDFSSLSKFPNAMKNLAMTSNSYVDSNGYLFKSSASSERFPAYNAFNGSLGSGASSWWRPSDFSVNGWLMLEVPVDCKILSHTIYLSNDSVSTVVILFQGSNDGTTFDTLGSADFGTASGYLERTVTISASNTYKYYRWYYGTNTGGSGTYIREITFTNVAINVKPGSIPTVSFSIYPTTLLSETFFAKLAAGTDASQKYYVFTTDENVNVQLSDLKVWTDTGSDEGYMALVVNDVVVHKYTLRTETYETIQFDEVSLSANDELAVVVGYDGTHSNCNFYMKS